MERKVIVEKNDLGKNHDMDDANFQKVVEQLKGMEEFKGATNFSPLAWEYIGKERSFDKKLSELFILRRTILVSMPDGDKIITHECWTRAKDWEPLFIDSHVETIFSSEGKYWCTLNGYEKPRYYYEYKPICIYREGEIAGYSYPSSGLKDTHVFIEENELVTFSLGGLKEKRFSYEGALALDGGDVPIKSQQGTNYVALNQRDINFVNVVVGYDNVDVDITNINGVITQKICTLPGEDEIESVEVVDNRSTFTAMEDLFVIVKYKNGKKALLIVYNDFSKIMISEQFDNIEKSLDFIVYENLPFDEEFDEGITFDCDKNGVKQVLRINLEHKMTGDVQFENIIAPSRISFTRPEESR